MFKFKDKVLNCLSIIGFIIAVFIVSLIIGAIILHLFPNCLDENLLGMICLIFCVTFIHYTLIGGFKR